MTHFDNRMSQHVGAVCQWPGCTEEVRTPVRLEIKPGIYGQVLVDIADVDISDAVAHWAKHENDAERGVGLIQEPKSVWPALKS
jgi:hypothetical protein